MLTLHIIVCFSTSHPLSPLKAPVVGISQYHLHKDIVVRCGVQARDVEAQEGEHSPAVGRRRDMLRKRGKKKFPLSLLVLGSALQPWLAPGQRTGGRWQLPWWVLYLENCKEGVWLLVFAGSNETAKLPQGIRQLRNSPDSPGVPTTITSLFCYTQDYVLSITM